jgi:hypothetical protein
MLGGGTVAGVVGALVGTVLSGVLTWAVIQLFLDEVGCAWWWLSLAFYDWLVENQGEIFQMAFSNPNGVIGYVLAVFLGVGYLRLGSVTFYDALGVGSPPSVELSISVSDGGTTDPYPGTYAFSEGESVTVTATAYTSHTFDHWVLDGSTHYQNPITVTMNDDHTIKAYFTYHDDSDDGGNPPGGGGGFYPKGPDTG